MHAIIISIKDPASMIIVMTVNNSEFCEVFIECPWRDGCGGDTKMTAPSL